MKRWTYELGDKVSILAYDEEGTLTEAIYETGRIIGRAEYLDSPYVDHSDEYLISFIDEKNRNEEEWYSEEMLVKA